MLKSMVLGRRRVTAVVIGYTPSMPSERTPICDVNANRQNALSAFGLWPQRTLRFSGALAVPALGATLIPWDGIAGIVRWGFGYPAFLAFVCMGGAIAVVRWRATRWLALVLIVPFSWNLGFVIWSQRLTIDNMERFFDYVAICKWLNIGILLGLVGVAVAGWAAWWRACRSRSSDR